MKFSGILFDLDGTLLDSLAAVDRAWRAWAGRNGLEGDAVMEVIHGRPARESVAALLKDAHEMEIKGETLWLERYESEDTEGTVALEGALNLIAQLEEQQVPWGIVTSGTQLVASARIKAAGLPTPTVLITADQVKNGKPDAEPYQLGAEKLGFRTEQCLVIEDAPAGVESGMAAACQVLALTSHFAEADLPQATAYISSLAQLTVAKDQQQFTLNIA